MFLQDLQELLSVHRIYPEFNEIIEPKVLSKEVEDSLAESQKEVRIKIIVLVGNKTGKTEELTEGLYFYGVGITTKGMVALCSNPLRLTALL